MGMAFIRVLPFNHAVLPLVIAAYRSTHFSKSQNTTVAGAAVQADCAFLLTYVASCIAN